MDTKKAIIQEGLTWKQLTQTHDCYDAERIDKLNLLLKGGYDICCKENSKKFLRRWRSESAAAYQDRLSFASYENNFGEIINDLSSTLFSKPVAVLQATDADDPDTIGEEPDPNSPDQLWQHKFTLKGDTMADFMREVQNESNAATRAYFGVDFQENGMTPYAYHIDARSVLDWECDDEGNFIFIVMQNDETVRTSVKQMRDTITTTFIVWTKGNAVKIEKYQITYPKNKLPNDDDIVPKVKSPPLPLTFKEIPIICCETPDNICVGQLIGQLAGSLFARYTTFLFCTNRGINPILTYKQGYELPANGDLGEINDNENRGEESLDANVAGKQVIGPSDELSWTEIKGNALTIVQEQLTKDKNEMYRLVNSLNSIISKADVSTAQTKASGVAKMIDNTAKEHMLETYAKLVKSWISKAFKIVFGALEQDVVWQCKGMDYYKVVDEADLQARILALPTYKTNVPSKTSYKQILMDTAYEMHPFVNVGTLNKIQEEINENVDAMDFGELHTSVNPEGTQEADSAKQMNKAVPQAAGKAPASKSQGASAAPAKPPVGDSGNQSMQPGSHLSNSPELANVPFVDYHVVFDMLKKDYKPKDLAWLKSSAIKGPVEVDANDIDFTGEDEWAANGSGKNGTDKVDKFAEVLKDKGFSAFNPVILAYMPHNDEKYQVVDGRHRVKASQQAGLPIQAYIVFVNSVEEDTPHMAMHSQQIKNDS